MKTPNELALVTLQEFSSTGTKGNKQLPSKNDSYRGAEYSTRKVWLPKVPIASTKSTFVISVLLVEVLVLKCTTMAPLHFYLTLFCICLTGGVVWSERWKSSRVASSSEKGSTAKPIDTKDIETFLNHYDCPVGIFYGSESGYTKGLALALSIKCGLMAKLMDPEDFDMMSLSSVSSSRLVLFVIATSGDGDFPENVKSLHRTIEVMLQQKAARLPNLQYGLFAVGNHNYTQFNEAGRILQRALVHLGAIPVVPYTEGDTALECNQLFAQWEVKALAAAKHFSGISDNAVKINDQTAQIALELAQLPVNGEAELDQYIEFVEKAGFTRRHSAMKVKLQIAKQWEVFNNQDGLQKYFQVKLISLTNEPFLFCAGDVVKIFPENSPALVNNLARVLNLCDLNETVVIRQYSNASLFDFPPPTSIRTLFSRYLDIASPVTNDFIEFALEQVTIAVDTKNHIELQLLKDQGSRMTVSNILEAFPDIRISLLDLIRLVPKLRPRFYSISSSAAVHPFEIHLTIAVKGHRRAVNNKEMLDFGVASGYLYSLSESNTNSDTAIISIQSTGFHLPSSPLTPIIMISAGAGIAPFRAFAQERANLKAQGISLGPAWVFFGCHSPSAVLYEDEWPAFISDGIIARFYVSHSRVNPRKYVQDLLLETALEVVDLISNQGGNIYVCGDANGMAKGVKASLCEILGDAKIISNLQKEKRYFEDVW